MMGLAMFSASLALAGCAATLPGWVDGSLPKDDTAFREDFKLVEMKCFGCHMDNHGLIRSMVNKDTLVEEWEEVVREMQDKQGSTIRDADIEPLTKVLSKWSQGGSK